MRSEEIPVLRLGKLLLVSIQTELVDTGIVHLQQSILEKIRDTGAEAVIIDISAQEMVDSYVANVLVETAKMVSLMGAQMVLVGMRAAVTLTLSQMGMDLPNISTAIDLEQGLEKTGYQLRPIVADKGRQDWLEDNLEAASPLTDRQDKQEKQGA